jgi:MFS family permease
MMALIYAVQGAWWPLLAVHLQDLGISGRGRGAIFATLALAAFATPLGAGQLADRLLPTQRLLALIYAVGSVGLAVFAVGPSTRFAPLFGLFLAYWLITAPSYSLANSLAFRNLPRPAEQFGRVRLWGTVGWMVVGWAVSAILGMSGTADPGRGTHEAFWVAAALSLVFAGYCLTLPNTPPLASSPVRGIDLAIVRDLAGRRPVAVFLGTAFVVSLTTPYVYQAVPTYLRALGLGRSWVPLAMTLGQLLEIVALAALPVFLRRLGYRRTLALGVGAWAVYYLNLAAHPPLWLALAGLPLNGVAIACFIIAGQTFLDSQAPPDRRASAQAVHVIVTSGLGSLVGNVLAGEVTYLNGGIGPAVFLLPCLLNAAAVVALLRAFRPEPWAASVLRPGARPSLAGARLSPVQDG